MTTPPIRGVLFPMGGDGDGRWRVNRYLRQVMAEGWGCLLRDHIPDCVWGATSDGEDPWVIVRAQDPPFGRELHPRQTETPMGAWQVGSIDEGDRSYPWTDAMLQTMSQIDGIHHGAATLWQYDDGDRVAMECDGLPWWRAKLVLANQLIAEVYDGIHILDAPEWHIHDDEFRAAFYQASDIPGARMFAENIIRSEGVPASIGMSTTINDGKWDAGGCTIRDVYRTWSDLDAEGFLPIVRSLKLIKAIIEGGAGPTQWVLPIERLNLYLEGKA